MDESTLSSRRSHVLTPEVDPSRLVSEVHVELLDPTVETLSLPIRSKEILTTDGIIILRPFLPIEGPQANAPIATHYTIEGLDRPNWAYLGRRGSILGTGKVAPPCVFTQTVTPYATLPSLFDIVYHCPPGGSTYGVNLSDFFRHPPTLPPLPRLGNSDWPSTLSQEAIYALSNFPRTFHVALNPAPLHGTDIAGQFFPDTG
jgi:hypothetical protein